MYFFTIYQLSKPNGNVKAKPEIPVHRIVGIVEHIALLYNTAVISYENPE